jgi:nitric oxide reductase NorQ protein
MVAIELGFPPPEVEEKVVAVESGLGGDVAAVLVQIGQAIRRSGVTSLREVASTRTLVAAGQPISAGVPMRRAVLAAVTGPLSDDPGLAAGLEELVSTFIPD